MDGAQCDRHDGDLATTRPMKPTSSPGSGYLHLSTTGTRAGFSTLQATYPLKLLSPSPLPSQPRNVSIVYTLAYGGGLVAGDLISLEIAVEENGGLVMLTQGSTKVFKNRPGIRPLSHSIRTQDNLNNSKMTFQRMHITLSPGSFILVLPDSISPFHGSVYKQAQRFILGQESSTLVLDWVNSGRGLSFGKDPGIGEVWAMERYDSINEIFLGNKLLMRERMNLVNPSSPEKEGMTRVAKRMAPYHLYATLLIYGPHFKLLLQHLRQMCDGSTQYQLKEVPGLVWSFSDTHGDSGLGGVVRIAARSVEDARLWIRGVLLNGGVKDLVGEGVWPRVI